MQQILQVCLACCCRSPGCLHWPISMLSESLLSHLHFTKTPLTVNLYRWPRNDVIPMTRFGAVDNKPRKQQQTIQRSAMIYGLSWTAFIIMCIIAVVTSIDIWVWSWCRTCIKESLTKLVWQIKSRNCWRWAGQMSVSASGWSVHWEWEQPTEWPNLAWGDLTLDISGK